MRLVAAVAACLGLWGCVSPPPPNYEGVVNAIADACAAQSGAMTGEAYNDCVLSRLSILSQALQQQRPPATVYMPVPYSDPPQDLLPSQQPQRPMFCRPVGNTGRLYCY